MHRISSCLNKQLVAIYKHTMLLDSLNYKLQKFLPEPLNKHCRVGSINKGCLTLVTTDASWATDLRYCLPTLRDQLRQNAGLPQLTTIKITVIVEPPSIKPAPVTVHPSPKLSPKAKKTIRNAAALCTYKPLQNILIKLASDREQS
jgi:hypothetical protein